MCQYSQLKFISLHIIILAVIHKTSALLIAGTGSGVGKTTVAMGLMAALGKHYNIQPFKVGPDFIDPGHHTRICGRPSRNLTACTNL
jgi:cobyrinic acid a,c-diamide synthase